MRDAFKAMPVKSDRNDARGIAQLMRLGWFRPVHCKSMAAQEMRALLTARKLVQSKVLDVQMSLRGLLRGFGLKLGPRHRDGSPGGSGNWSRATQPWKLLRRRSSWSREGCGLMSTPGVGAIVALTYVAAIDDPARFKSSKGVGAHFGLTRKKYQSDETDITGRISKIGDEGVRTALYEAGHIILTQPLKGCTSPKSWAMGLPNALA